MSFVRYGEMPTEVASTPSDLIAANCRPSRDARISHE